MTKRPEENIFLEFYKDLVGSEYEKAQKIADKFSVTVQTGYNWIEFFTRKTKPANFDTTVVESFAAALQVKEKLPNRLEVEGYVEVPEDILVVCLSDIHVGSNFCDEKELLQHVELIKNTKRVKVLVLGDMSDYGPDAPPGLDKDQKLSITEVKKAIRLLATEIGAKVLATCSGCHSYFLYNSTGELVEEEFAENTYTKIFLGGSGVVNLQVGQIPYRIYMTHKLKGGSKLNPSRRIMQMNEMDVDFDIGIEAHHHVASIGAYLRRQKVITTINCGSFKHVDTYANKMGIIAQPLHIPGFYVSASKRLVIPFMDWRDGISLLK